MQNNLEQFDDLWGSFITALKGALRNAAATDQLDYSHAQAILAEQSMCWQGDYEPEGRWINGLIKTDEAKGALVRKILIRDMQFSEMNPKAVSNVALGIGVVGGGAVGYCVSALSGLGMVGTIATTVATGAVGGIIGNNRKNVEKAKTVESVIDAYIGQLDSYYHSVVAALNS